ncbi:aquaporin family protein [Gordonia sp. TBRC 11910]|uniref:Aquaporin family protein n=2 Tax=Gordonia asplenii TaxID=2725283 RepID=A0A848KZ92_9ACTN|nr:aquaporin family protein [Gordonia asplenii]
MPHSIATWNYRPALAEFIGSAMLVMAIVGSGIAASSLSPNESGLQLLEMSVTTGLALTVLVLVLGPVSGGHFNPAVSLIFWVIGRRGGTGLTTGELATFVVAQVVGALSGVMLANVMFGLRPVSTATQHRASAAHLVAEVLATTILIVVILGLVRGNRVALVAPAVGSYVSAAFWFTSSTCFANPAVTVARALSDSVGGISPSSVPAFVVAQVAGAVLGLLVGAALFPVESPLRR